MWTPKRIVLLVASFGAFLAFYVGYTTTYIGRLDGLPPLPEMYGPPGEGDPDPPDPPKRGSILEQKLVQAFGPGCEELKQAIRLELHSKNMVLASTQFTVAPDGRVILTPLSVALFGKPRGDGREIEINTIRGKVAYLKFDRPVTNISEISGRKIVEAELAGCIKVVNNRRRKERDEDLKLDISHGPLYYNEAKHLIWTKDFIDLEDHKSKPLPNKVRGKGMEMELLTEAPKAPPGTPASRKQRGENITGIKRIVLHSDVDMKLYVEGGSGFLGSPAKEPVKSAPKGPQPAAVAKSRIDIKTPGRFEYDIYKDHDIANFSVPPNDPSQPPQSRWQVRVERHHPDGKMDQLDCQHLTLRMRRREKDAPGKLPPPSASSQGEGAVDVETAHATAKGKEVVLTSDVEKMRAHGNDFFYDAVKKLTILKGEPEMEAEKDGSIIHARELRIQDIKAEVVDAKGHQEITASGPGRIHLMEKGTNRKTTHAYWKTSLRSSKDGALDLLVLTGNAKFVDDKTEQKLEAQIIKVWLTPADNKVAEGSAPAGTVSGRRPQHLEATTNVVARSREMNIDETSRLVVWFKDVPLEALLPAGAPPPSPAPGANKASRGVGAPPVGAPQQGAPQQGTNVPRSPRAPAKTTSRFPAPLPLGPAQENAIVPPRAPGLDGPGLVDPAPAEKGETEKANPIHLSARTVEATVWRNPAKSMVEHLTAEGKVHVRQEAAKADEKDTDVVGDELEMNGSPEGNVLVVRGDLGQLRKDKIYILGPEVNIDQVKNKVWVHGPGAMQMESSTDFQGAPLKKPVPLTVHWNKTMFFDGEKAEFDGGIQAEQENSRLACQHLEVTFDRPISLKHGSVPGTATGTPKAGEPPARVRLLVCDHDVRIEERTVEGDKPTKVQRLEAPAVMVTAREPEARAPHRPGGKEGRNNAGNEVYASGPGTVRLWHREGEDPMSTSNQPAPKGKVPVKTAKAAPKTGPAATPGQPEPMKLTYVAFGKRMDAHTHNNTMQFWENVRVYSVPSENPNMPIDLDTILAFPLAEGAMYMRSDRLKVLKQQEGEVTNMQMEAHGRAMVQAKEFWARADSIYYNQAKNQVILDGTQSGQATLYKVDIVGSQPSVIQGTKIIYNRTTGRYEVQGGRTIEGSSPAPKR